MIEVPVVHRWLDGTHTTRAGVVVSDEAGGRFPMLKEAGLTITITQKGSPPKPEPEAALEVIRSYDPTPLIEVALSYEDMTKGPSVISNYVARTAKDLSPFPDGTPHPKGTVIAVQNTLLEFSPAAYIEWIKSRP